MLAKVLRRYNYRVNVTELVHYTVFHLGLIRFLNSLPTSKEMIKFYEDEPPSPTMRFEVLRRLLPLMVIVHVLGLSISVLKLKLVTRFCDVVVEHEGFIFKQLADLLYFSCSVGALRNRSLGRRMLRWFSELALRILTKLAANLVIVVLDAPHNVLRVRYVRRGSHVEPFEYTEFQKRFYSLVSQRIPNAPDLRALKVIRIPSELGIAKVSWEIIRHIIPLVGEGSCG